MANDVFGIVGTTVVGAFHVEAVVAEGGFAVVYRAYHGGFRAPVALKCLKIPQYFSEEEQGRFAEQFHAEAELLFKLSASIPAIVRPLHVEAVIAPDGSFMPFLALEWLDGETLEAVAESRRAEGKPFTLEELVRTLTPVARALERAHAFPGPDGPLSIVHRDMKPENIFLARVAGEDVVKILDFGIGKVISLVTEAAGRAAEGDVESGSFTPAYAAPEQWLPKRFGATGPWTDVWGLALTMVETLAGRDVIDGDHAAMMGVAIDPVRRPTPRAEGVAVGDAVEAVFLRALAVEPKERFQNAGEFWNAMLSALTTDAQQRHGRASPGKAPARSGAYAAATSTPPVLGRHNVIPDLEPPEAAQSIELDLEEPPRSQRFEVGTRPFDLEGDDRPPPRARGSGSLPAVLRSTELPQSSAARSPIPDAPSPPSARSAAGTEVLEPTDRTSSAQVGGASRVPLAPPNVPRNAAIPEALESSALRRFAVPAGMIAGGVLLTWLDGAYAGSEGQVLSLGPVRLAFLAAALVLCGIGLAGYRFFVHDAEDTEDG